MIAISLATSLRKIGVTIPTAVVLRADQVIEKAADVAY